MGPDVMRLDEIWYYRYELHARRPLSSVALTSHRGGALLKWVPPAGASGYADCHPWPELGDQDLQRQLELLKQRITTPLTRRSLLLAQADAQARAHCRSSFAGVTIPASHHTALDLSEVTPEQLEDLARAGFSRIKCKAGPGFAARIGFLQQLRPVMGSLQLKLRLDFNGTLPVEEFQMLSAALEPLGDVLDFLEDPCRYDADVWARARTRHGIRLAIDRVAALDEVQPGSVDVVVVKPAVDDPGRSLEFAGRHRCMLCITTYMDHPVGQMSAAAVAASLAREAPQVMDVCGLLSHSVYRNDSFVASVRAQGPRLQAAPGTGIGFDQQLDELAWTRLA